MSEERRRRPGVYRRLMDRLLKEEMRPGTVIYVEPDEAEAWNRILAVGMGVIDPHHAVIIVSQDGEEMGLFPLPREVAELPPRRREADVEAGMRLTDEQLAAEIHDQFLRPSLVSEESVWATGPGPWDRPYATLEEPQKALARALAMWHRDRVAQAIEIAVKQTKRYDVRDSL